MNRDQVEGRMEEVKGSIKESVGEAKNNPDLRDEGTADKAAGKVQSTVGDAKEKVKSAIDKL